MTGQRWHRDLRAEAMWSSLLGRPHWFDLNMPVELDALAPADSRDLYAIDAYGDTSTYGYLVGTERAERDRLLHPADRWATW